MNWGYVAWALLIISSFVALAGFGYASVINFDDGNFWIGIVCSVLFMVVLALMLGGLFSKALNDDIKNKCLRENTNSDLRYELCVRLGGPQSGQ